jgi:uncharacterized membrane protein (DUF2068 family)
MMLLIGALVILIAPAIAAADQDENLGIAIVAIATVASSLMFIFAVAGIIGAIGILKQRRWARYVLLVLGAIWAIKAPVGTALGVYTFYVLTRDEIVNVLQPTTS